MQRFAPEYAIQGLFYYYKSHLFDRLSILLRINLTLPVFELSVFILPEGKMRLRIFETKYLKMLSMISSHQMFVIQLTSKPAGAEHNNWGSLVKIKDFNQGEDGVLEIEVHCCALVQLADITLDKNNLVFGKIT